MSLDAIADALVATRGADAQLWIYTASLGELHIRLRRSGMRGNTHVICNGTESIRAMASWVNARLEVEGALNDRIVLVDVDAGFEVVCVSVRVLRDVDPVY